MLLLAGWHATIVIISERTGLYTPVRLLQELSDKVLQQQRLSETFVGRLRLQHIHLVLRERPAQPPASSQKCRPCFQHYAMARVKFLDFQDDSCKVRCAQRNYYRSRTEWLALCRDGSARSDGNDNPSSRYLARASELMPRRIRF